jgi:peptidoglycan/xylan/chitin deacetylase (PgdA/CDA1 family)
MSVHSLVRRIRPEILSLFYRRIVALDDLGPIITFTFDDFPRSALTCGGLIIERYSGNATYYVTMGLMGSTNALGEQFCLSDLHSLTERGHEVAGHTFSHPSARRVSSEAFIMDAQLGNQRIRHHISHAASNNFAYPFGEVTMTMKRRMGAQMRSCRGTAPGLNGPEVDLNLLRANPLYGGMESSPAARRLIIDNEERKRWLIFYSHDVTSNPSQFGCTPALLEDTVSFAVSRGMKVLTVGNVIDALCGAE